MIQCDESIDVKIIRTEIIRTLGTPSSSYSNVLSYSGKIIEIRYLDDKRPLNYSNLIPFYVGGPYPPILKSSPRSIIDQELDFRHATYWWPPLRNALKVPEPAIYLPQKLF